MKKEKLLEEFLLLTPGDPWDHSQWLHRVPRGPVSRAGAESRTSVAPPPEAFAGSVLDLSRPWRRNPKMRPVGGQFFNYDCFLGMFKVSFKFPGHLLSNYVKPTLAELPFLLGLGVFWGVDLDGTQKVRGPTRFKVCGREMSTLLKQI